MGFLSRVVLATTLGVGCVYGCGRLSQSAGSRLGFASGEHALLGDQAYSRVAARHPELALPLARADGQVVFTYGELVALSGDFFAGPDDLFEGKGERDLRHPLAGNLAKGRSLVAREAADARDQRRLTRVEDLPTHVVGDLLAFPGHLGLARRNTEHFGWRSLLAYARHHERALMLARSSRDSAAELAVTLGLRRRALFVNAFADHFLTDAFAAGHLRNPRVETLAWAQERGVPELVAQLYSKFLHDNDHRLTADSTEGLQVTNARGDRWRTRVDGELELFPDQEPLATALPVAAVERSVDEVFAAMATGAAPLGPFEALELAPFVAAGEDDIAVYFGRSAPAARVRQWLGGLGAVGELPGCKRLVMSMTQGFLEQLPDLMQRLRRQVEEDAGSQSEVARLPAALVTGFRRVH